jgi:hypothetical protein
MSTNQRESPRKRLSGIAHVTAPSGSVAARCQDVSLTGMSLASSMNLRVGSECSIDVMLPGTNGIRRRVQMAARVIDCVLSTAHGFRLGLEFVRLNAEARAGLEDCMNPA